MFNLNTLLKINHAIGYLLTPFKSLIAYIWPDIKINKVFNFIKTVINIIGLISLFISVPIIVYLDPIDFLSESLQNGIIYIKNYYQDLIKTILKGFIKNIEEKKAI